jgi:transcriptional regulator with XRE-family HTH domain
MGERCAEARRRIGYTQRGMAKALNMSPSWVRECEGGGQFPPAWLVAALAEAARLPIGWFYGYGGVA